MSAETNTRFLITGFDLDVQAAFRGSYRAMMTDLLSSAELAHPGRWAGEIYVDLAKGEDLSRHSEAEADDHPEQGPLIATWAAVLVMIDGQKTIISLTIRGPAGEELP
jgi:hypothetical protein